MHAKDLLSEEVHGSEGLGIFDLEDYKGLRVPGGLTDHPKTLLLWTECLYPPKMHMLKPNPQCDGIWKWDLWEVIRFG